MFERIWSLAKAQSAIGSMRQTIVSRLDFDPLGVPAFAGLRAPAGTGPKPAVTSFDRPDEPPPPERVGDSAAVSMRHSAPGPATISHTGMPPTVKGGAGSVGVGAVFTYRSRLDRRALERARPRERDDLLEFEALMEFAISQGVRRQAVDLSYLDTPVSIELTAMLPSFGKALRELRRFAQDHGWPVVTVAYGDEQEMVTRVVSPEPTDVG